MKKDMDGDIKESTKTGKSKGKQENDILVYN